jgi:WD40 repeat protein
LRVWSWRTGEHLRTLEGHTGQIISVALSGKFAISISDSIFNGHNTLWVWNWQTGEALGVYPYTYEGREQLLAEHPHLSQVAFDDYALHESGWSIIWDFNRLKFRNPQGQSVGIFIADADIDEVQMVEAGTVMAFDRTGRVLFLRWHPGKGQA